MTTFSVECGDVRILAHNPTVLAERLHISQLTFAEQLGIGEQQALYQAGALVPDPETIRRCTPEEVARFIGPLEDPKETDVVVYLDSEATTFLHTSDRTGWRPFGRTTSQPGQLTTTPVKRGKPRREGMHIDSGEQFERRLGLIAGPRQLLVGTHSAPLLFGEAAAGDATSSRLRELLRSKPELLGEIACLHVSLTNEIYQAWTGGLLHDGSTWLSATERGGSGSPSSIVFVPY
jgi:hypothetical protein